MFRKVSIATMAVACMCQGAAFAETLSFDQVVGEAAVSYPSVLSKASSRDAAASDVKVAEWQRYPVPSIQSTTDGSGNANFVFRVQQVLWAGGSITGGIESARFLREASEKGIKEAKFDVASRAIDAYVDAVRQQGRRIISQQNLKEHQLLDDAIRRRVQSEVSPEVDHQLSQARLSQAINDLSSIDQGLSRSLNSLSQLSGRNVTEALPIDLAAIPIPENSEDAVRQAIARSPVLSRLALEEEAAEAQVKVKKAVIWPTLSLRYEKSLNNNAAFYDTPSDNRIMVVIEAQPGAGFSAFAGVDSAVAKKNAAIEERRGVLRDLTRLISDAWSDMEAARSQLKYATSAKASAKDVSESYKRQYIIGRKAWLDVLNAVREATQSELYVVDATAQVAVSTLRIALLTDKLKLENKKYALNSTPNN